MTHTFPPRKNKHFLSVPPPNINIAICSAIFFMAHAQARGTVLRCAVALYMSCRTASNSFGSRWLSSLIRNLSRQVRKIDERNGQVPNDNVILQKKLAALKQRAFRTGLKQTN